MSNRNWKWLCVWRKSGLVLPVPKPSAGGTYEVAILHKNFLSRLTKKHDPKTQREVTLPLYPVLWCSFPSLLQRSCPHLAGTLASTRGRKCTFFSGYFFLFQETNCKSCHAYYKRCKKDRPMKNVMVASFFFSDSSFISNTDNIGFQWLDAKKAYMKIFPKNTRRLLCTYQGGL